MIVHAFIKRELGEPLSYPGRERYVTELMDSRLLAKAIEWAANHSHDAAKNETFNINNGDTVVLEGAYVKLANHLNMPAAEPKMVELSNIMKDEKYDKVWQEMVKKYGLENEKLAGNKQRKGMPLVLDDRLISKQYITSKLDARIDDTTYGDGWDGVTDRAPSVNAVYDKINSMGATSDVWTREDSSSDARVRTNKTGFYGFGNSTDMAFTEITHKLTLDGDLRVGAIDGSTKDIYLDDGVQFYKYGASGSTSMLHLNSSNGNKSPINLAIGSSNPTVPLEINKAEGTALDLNDGTGLFQIGADSAANIGMNATKIQARDGSGSASTLNLNAAGGDVKLSNGSGTVTVENDLVVDGSGNVTGALTLANSGVTANSYGGATAIPVITVDAKGRLTSVTTASITTNLTVDGDSVAQKLQKKYGIPIISVVDIDDIFEFLLERPEMRLWADEVGRYRYKFGI